MTNLEKFNETVGILVKAYMNDELKHDDCACCAVGNIVRAAGVPHLDDNKIKVGSCSAWKWVFYTHIFDGKAIQKLNTTQNEFYFNDGINVISKTGYQWQDLAKVEYAFEAARVGTDKSEWMFNGLMAVVEVLAEIHSIDLTAKENAKLLFVKCPAS